MCVQCMALIYLEMAIMEFIYMIWHGLKGLALLFLLMLLQFINFVSPLSIFIALIAFISYAWEVIWKAPMSSSSQAIWTLLLIAVYGEMNAVSIGQTPWYRNMADQHYIFLRRVPGYIYHTLYFFAFIQLYFQYQIAHKHNTLRRTPHLLHPGFDLSEQLDKTATALFLLSLCFMTFAAIRSTVWIQCVVNSYLDEDPIPVESSGLLSYVILELCLLLLYAVPSALVGMLCKYNRFPLYVAFFGMNFVGYATGTLFMQIENACVFPAVPYAPAPHGISETHMCARHYLLYSLFCFISMSYYCSEAFRYSSMTEENNFYIYALLVSMTTIQTTKAVSECHWLQRRLRFRILHDMEYQIFHAPVLVDVEIQADPQPVIIEIPQAEGSTDINANPGSVAARTRSGNTSSTITPGPVPRPGRRNTGVRSKLKASIGTDKLVENQATPIAALSNGPLAAMVTQSLQAVGPTEIRISIDSRSTSERSVRVVELEEAKL